MKLLHGAGVLACWVALHVPAASWAQTPVIPQTPAVTSDLVGGTRDEVIREGIADQDDPERTPLRNRTATPQTGRLAPELAAQTLMLTDVRLKGNTLFPAEDFSGLWSDLTGREVTLGELADVADLIQTQYRREGYVFTRVIVLQDGFQGGVATIRVIEGVLGDVTVEESAEPVGPVLELLERMAKKLVGIENPHISDLERVLLLMNDVPGITRATAVPRRSPDGEPGVINLVINVERTPISAVLFANNRQAPSAGQGVFGISGEYASYSSAGDTTRLTALTSFWNEVSDLNERQIFQVEHSRYVTADGLVVNLRGLYSRSNLGDELEALEIIGDEYEVEVGLAYPIVRTRPFSLSVGSSFQVSRTVTDVLDGAQRLTEDELRIFTVGLDALIRDFSGFTYLDAGVIQGIDALGASEPDDRLSRQDGDPGALVFVGGIERDQELYFNGLSLNVRAEGQYSTEPLLASMEFHAGGTSIGRGYDPSEISGDHGFGVATELRYTLGLDFVPVSALEESSMQFYGFFDYARIFNRGTGSPSAAHISSFGGGLRFDLPQDFFVELEVAKPRDALQRTGDDDFRVFFEVQKRL